MLRYVRCFAALTFVAPLVAAAGSASETGEPRAPEWRSGALTIKPFGFLEVIGMSRSQTTVDSVSTRFGNIPLTNTPSETIASIAHSRLMLTADYNLIPEVSSISVYLESDFLNPKPDSIPYRWRQYWASWRFGKWEMLGGQAWSLLRPNRAGIQTEKDLMNTDVIDPAYHVGIVGVRRRQVRLTRNFGKQTLAFAWESNGDFEAKLATDRGPGHFEIAGLTGHSGRRALQVSAILHPAPRMRLVSQQYAAHRAVNEALNIVPSGVSGFATLEGLEFDATKRIEVYSYAGLVYGDRSNGNRTVRQYTAGFNWRRPMPSLFGYITLSVQYSYLDRSVWDGRNGMMQFLMYRLRYTIP